MATGLLALVTGASTRLAPFYEKAEKTYRAVVRFGMVSDTYDAEGVITETGVALPVPAVVEEELNGFRGKFAQKPPPVSAKKIGGVPAYKLVRRNVPVDLKPVDVVIKELKIEEWGQDRVEIEVTCSAGTYIRSLAHDLGQKLGCGALLSALRRTRVGEFSVDEARTENQLADMAREGRLGEAVIPAGQLLAHLPAESVNASVEAQIRQGRQFRTSPFVIPPGSPLVRVLSRSGELIAIGKLVIPNLYHPSTVFQVESI